jgi:hypothetical protein
MSFHGADWCAAYPCWQRSSASTSSGVAKPADEDQELHEMRMTNFLTFWGPAGWICQALISM